MRTLCKILLILGVVSGAWGDSLNQLLPSHRAIFHVKSHSSEYLLSLGTLRKINGHWAATKERKIPGELQRVTYEINRSVSIDEAWLELSVAINADKKTTLFSCEGLDCGSSNAWANNRFQIKQLYGLDQSQRYRVVRDQMAGKTRYFVLYMVQRGNRRIYAQIDQIAVSEQDDSVISRAEQIIESLKVKGYFVVPSDSGKVDQGLENVHFNEMVLQKVVDALRIVSSENIVVVGHGVHRKGGSNQESKRWANEFVLLLGKAGLSSSEKLATFGVGLLAPRERYPSNRVELVLIRAAQP